VGDVVTAHAWVIAMNPEQTSYGVIVATDTMQYVHLWAQADKDVVPPSVLGRWAMVKAKVTEQNNGVTTKVQILDVAPIAPAATVKALR
jgi:hypothetical protein